MAVGLQLASLRDVHVQMISVLYSWYGRRGGSCLDSVLALSMWTGTVTDTDQREPHHLTLTSTLY